ncbi:MAG: bifunctional 5,10-methylenetetrahydrofolate dehydrogenase/5,10-methenyltetrahydrofolate cyclohydrolase [Bacilli bacterium]|nr:bifunctional 5,10-methylenetetrahydrofolate dehydrogenase/5,10-methenyltetrahydrofolate cyclohydrolase [Bacilli bacterium]
MYILDGKELAKNIRTQVKLETSTLSKPAKLLVILVGKDPASQIYVSSKEKACRDTGIEATTIVFDENITQKEITNRIDEANNDPTIHGILVQLPLPKHLEEQVIINHIAPSKDVDGLTFVNQGRLLAGQKGIVPATPKGVMHLIDAYHLDLTGKNAIVIGRSNLVGKPLALLLMQRNATVTVAHSKTNNLAGIIASADIVCSAVGIPNFITADMIKPGAVVIDIGISRVFGKVVGDVDYEAVSPLCSYITPVPGGIGPMTIASLLENVLECYKLV